MSEVTSPVKATVTCVASTTMPQLKTIPPPSLTVQTSITKVESITPAATQVTLQTTPPTLNAVKTMTISQKSTSTPSSPVTKLNNSLLVAQLCGKSIVLNKSTVKKL